MKKHMSVLSRVAFSGIAILMGFPPMNSVALAAGDEVANPPTHHITQQGSPLTNPDRLTNVMLEHIRSFNTFNEYLQTAQTCQRVLEQANSAAGARYMRDFSQPRNAAQLEELYNTALKALRDEKRFEIGVFFLQVVAQSQIEARLPGEARVPVTIPALAKIYLNEIFQNDQAFANIDGFKNLVQLANQGDVNAARELAEDYQRGLNGLKPNPKRAAHYFKLAADRGDETMKVRAASFLDQDHTLQAQDISVFDNEHFIADANGNLIQRGTLNPLKAERNRIHQQMTALMSSPRAHEVSENYYRAAAAGPLGWGNYDYGKSLLSAGNVDEAIVQFHTAQQKGINKATLNLADAYTKKGNFPRAIELLNAMIESQEPSLAEQAQKELPRVMTFYRTHQLEELVNSEKRANHWFFGLKDLKRPENQKKMVEILEDKVKHKEYGLSIQGMGTFTLNELARAYAHGTGVKVDLKKADELFQQSRALQTSGQGGYNGTEDTQLHGQILAARAEELLHEVGGKRDTSLTANYLHRATQLQSPRSFYLIGKILAGDDEKMKKKVVEAITPDLGHMIYGHDDPTRLSQKQIAAEFLRKATQDNHLDQDTSEHSLISLAHLYERNPSIGKPKQRERVAEEYARLRNHWNDQDDEE